MLQLELNFTSFIDEKIKAEEVQEAINDLAFIGQDIDIKKDYAIRTLHVTNKKGVESALVYIIFDFRDKKRPSKVFKTLSDFKSFYYENIDKNQYLSFETLGKAKRFLETKKDLKKWAGVF